MFTRSVVVPEIETMFGKVVVTWVTIPTTVPLLAGDRAPRIKRVSRGESSRSISAEVRGRSVGARSVGRFGGSGGQGPEQGPGSASRLGARAGPALSPIPSDEEGASPARIGLGFERGR